MKFNVKSILVEETTPDADGRRLAEAILKSGGRVADLELDVRDLAPEDLVSSFVNGFLHGLQSAGVDVRHANRIKWISKFASETKKLEQLVALYVEDLAREATGA